MADQKLTWQDIQQLQSIKKGLPADDPRHAMLDAAIQQAIQPNMIAGPVPKELQGPPQSSVWNALDSTVSGNDRMVWGALKGAGHTLSNAAGQTAQLGSISAGPAAMNVSVPPVNVSGPDVAKAVTGNPDAFVPHGTMEKAGFGTEQFGEFFAPGFGEEALLGRGAGLLPRVAYSGLTNAGLANVQQGTAANSGVNLALGAGIPLALGGAGLVGKKTGSWLLNNAMEFTKPVLARQNPGEYAIENGSFGRFWSGGKDAIRQQAADLASQAGQRGEDLAYNAPGRNIDIGSVADMASNKRAQFAMQGNLGLADQAEALKNVVKQTSTIAPGGDGYLTFNRPNMVSPGDALDVRRGLGAARQWNANNFFEPPAVSLRDGMYGNLNNQLHAAVPGLQQADTAYANLAPFAKSIDNKPSLWPLMLTGEMGGAAELGAGGSGIGGALRGMGTYLAARSAPVAYATGRTGNALVQAAPAIGSLSLGLMDHYAGTYADTNQQ